MASKKRGGLSSREYAAAQKAKAAPKVSTRATASKSVSPLVGAGPLMTGQARVGATAPAIGPMLQWQTRATSSSKSSSSKSSSRDLASKAQQSKLNPASSVKAAEASGLLGTMSKVPAGDTIKAGGGGIFDRLKNKSMGLMAGLGEMYGNNGLSRARGNELLGDDIAKGSRYAYDNTLGTKTAFASEDDGMSGLGRALRDASEPDIPTSYGDNGETFFNGNEEMSLQGRMAGSKSNQVKENNPIFGVPTASASELNYTPDNYRQNSSQEKNYSSQYDMPTGPTQEEITQQQNELYGNTEQAPIDQALPRVTNQVRGSGMFGTGKGVGNPAGSQDDPYIKELRKAYSSNGGEKWLRKQFEELISALDPTYAQMQKEGTDALNAQLNNDNTKLASVMNANNTGDSEQRAQLMAQQQQGSQTALGNLLAKLSQSKAQDVSGYRSQMNSALAQNADKQQSNQQRLMEQIQQYRTRQEDQAYKNASLAGRGGGTTKAGSLSYLGDDANGNPVYYNTTTGQRTTEAGLKRKQSNPFEEAMAAMIGGQQGGQQVQYDENGRPYIEQ